MAELQAMIAEIQGIVTTAVDLPAPVPDTAINWYTTVQGSKKSFVEELKGSLISLPCVVLKIGMRKVDPEFGLDTWAMRRMPVSVYYIQRWGGAQGKQDYVDSQAIAIAAAIDAPGLTFSTFQAMESGEINSDEDEDINMALSARSEVTVIASCVKWEPGFFVNIA